MAREADVALQLKIFRIAFAFGLFCVLLLAVRSMMFGSFGKAGLILAAMFGGALVFALDDKYWVLLPFLSGSGLSVPRLPFSGTELGCLVLAAVFFVRLALRKSTPFRFNRDLAIALPVLGWMTLVWMLNPVGLAIFGSNTIGGRFYFDIALGAVALFVLSTIRMSESDAKILFFAILFGMLWALARGIIFPGADPDAIILTGAEPEKSTRYAFVICASIFMLLFSLLPLSSILASPVLIPLFSILAILVVYSGKRKAFAILGIAPFLRAFLLGRERLLTSVVAVFGAVFLFFAIAGDRTLYRLPNSARRALAVVAPQYRKSAEDGGIHDYFRHEMREQARYIIQDSPWFGRKGFAMSIDQTSWILFGGGRTSLFASHAYAGNWHSTWYAYAADFGIPCMVLWLFFSLYVLAFSYRACRRVVIGRYLPACCLYYSMVFFVDDIFSYLSGHSANTTMKHFICYGMLLAIVRSYRDLYRPVDT